MIKIILALTFGASLTFAAHPAKAESATEIIAKVEKNLAPVRFHRFDHLNFTKFDHPLRWLADRRDAG